MSTQTYPPLPRAALSARTLPPAPIGHHSHKHNPDCVGTLALIAHNPYEPRHVRTFHQKALTGSLVTLAALVRSVSVVR